MKKITLLLIFFSILFSSIRAETTNDVSTGQAAIESKNSASAIAWSVFGISLLIAVGIVVAIAINKEK